MCFGACSLCAPQARYKNEYPMVAGPGYVAVQPQPVYQQPVYQQPYAHA